ncbi:fumarylacetoacetate hydrolase family protein [Alkalihalobacillus trypoxylicola]|uniref:Fumarylacetoacetase-like C-terminal domain-containing protein n=1 Tax=Alkalihalobacillus trypoxylicola TaxID=519424 RepID=A0A161Q3I4_9BACI|nr:fumarylacetoacetate hydrolase family protein [Alkalihalobacillus trypoxylicola]KYG30561.1 hypothetical protein AZF04_19500 [Alkalihalobacillus trypoxylicola]
MKLSTIKLNGKEESAFYFDSGYIPLSIINQHFHVQWPLSFESILKEGLYESVLEWYQQHENELKVMEKVGFDQAISAPLFRSPGKIIGIGMNYENNLGKHQDYIEPVSFMKPSTSIVGQGAYIIIPSFSKETTAEAELAIIIKEDCKNVSVAEAPNKIAGYTTSLDMTEAAIHRENPRYLTRAKGFDTFLSIGPTFLSASEINNLEQLEVKTVKNGEEIAKNNVTNMRYSPYFIVSFLSQSLTLKAGDILLTGTPGSVEINDGDEVSCQINNFPVLINKVRVESVSL